MDPLLRIYSELATLTAEIRHLREDLTGHREALAKLTERTDKIERSWIRMGGVMAGIGVVVGVVLRFLGV